MIHYILRNSFRASSYVSTSGLGFNLRITSPNESNSFPALETKMNEKTSLGFGVIA